MADTVTATDDPEDAPPGWTTEDSADDVRSWLGADERVVCRTEGDGWIAYSQPRSELGTAHQVTLTDEPTDRERALELASEYMGRHGDEE